jgi:hypothetical protein
MVFFSCGQNNFSSVNLSSLHKSQPPFSSVPIQLPSQGGMSPGIARDNVQQQSSQSFASVSKPEVTVKVKKPRKRLKGINHEKTNQQTNPTDAVSFQFTKF